MPGSASPVYVVVPGRIDTPTGGFVYDRAMIAALRAAGQLADVIVLPGEFPQPSPAAISAAARCLASLADGSPVVVDGLALTPLASVLANAAGRLRKIALVHHPLCDESGLTPAVAQHWFEREREALARVAGVIVTSHATAARLADFGVSAARVRAVLPGAVEVPRPPAARLYRPPGRPPRLLCVASLTVRKGQDQLVRALAALRRCPWRLDLVGPARDPAFARRLRLAARCRRLHQRVHFIGPLARHRLQRRYRRADLFVLASRHEGFGMAPVEAVAHGLPVVTTRAGALPEALPPGTATLVPAGDIAALTRALRPLLIHRTRRHHAAWQARRCATRMRSWAAAGSEFVAAVQGFLKQ
jgi:glycosyltransferase involved in cell wall biosynthesis